jgi:hypothetical protein
MGFRLGFQVLVLPWLFPSGCPLRYLTNSNFRRFGSMLKVCPTVCDTWAVGSLLGKTVDVDLATLRHKGDCPHPGGHDGLQGLAAGS